MEARGETRGPRTSHWRAAPPGPRASRSTCTTSSSARARPRRRTAHDPKRVERARRASVRVGATAIPSGGSEKCPKPPTVTDSSVMTVPAKTRRCRSSSRRWVPPRGPQPRAPWRPRPGARRRRRSSTRSAAMSRRRYARGNRRSCRSGEVSAAPVIIGSSRRRRRSSSATSSSAPFRPSLVPVPILDSSIEPSHHLHRAEHFFCNNFPTFATKVKELRARCGTLLETMGVPGAGAGATDPDLATRCDYDDDLCQSCLLYTSPSPRDQRGSRMPSSA